MKIIKWMILTLVVSMAPSRPAKAQDMEAAQELQDLMTKMSAADDICPFMPRLRILVNRIAKSVPDVYEAMKPQLDEFNKTGDETCVGTGANQQAAQQHQVSTPAVSSIPPVADAKAAQDRATGQHRQAAQQQAARQAGQQTAANQNSSSSSPALMTGKKYIGGNTGVVSILVQGEDPSRGGANVYVTNDSSTISLWLAKLSNPVQQTCDDLSFAPGRSNTKAGQARFNELAPGRYLAIAGDNSWFNSSCRFTWAYVQVAAGQVGSVTLELGRGAYQSQETYTAYCDYFPDSRDCAGQ